MSLSTFLACFIAIATAFVLVEGGGWQKKEQERKRERERVWPAPLSLRDSTDRALCQAETLEL